MALDENPMVTITDRNSNSDDLSIFPPVNHEGLHNPKSLDSPFFFTSLDSPFSSQSPFSSTSSFSSSTSISLDSDDASLPPDSPASADHIYQSHHHLDAKLQIPAASRWLDLGLEILRRKIFNSSIPGYGALVAPFRSFPLLTTLATLYAGSLVLKWLRLRRNRQSKINMLMDAVKEKDEKIVKLLDQIAQLNQVLLTRNTTH